eukprot:EG_transcript_6729
MGEPPAAAVGPPWHYSTAEVAVSAAVLGAVLCNCWYEMYQLRNRYLEPGALEGIEPGIFGYLRDDSDHQWWMFRTNGPTLLAAALLHLGAGRALRARRAAVRTLTMLELLAGLAGLAFLHGSDVLFICLFAAGNFLLSRLSASIRPDTALWQSVPALTWVFCIVALLTASWLSELEFAKAVHPRLAPLDAYRGIMRWSIPFNFFVLRMISFTIDHHKACADGGRADAVLHYSPPPTYRALAETHRPLDRYSVLNYYAYLLYLPLYVAGPICSFNAWQVQMEHPQTEYKRKDLGFYSLRIANNLFLLEFFSYQCFAIAICAKVREKPALFATLTAGQTVFLSYACIYFLWLKFMLIWRCFRLWALVGGILTPENMTRCLATNYSVKEFWRSWHHSYNVWLLRYMYIPLGGSRRRLLNSFIIFNFVAIWHDLDWRLLHWAWGIVLILVPETALTWLFSGPRLLAVRGSPYYRHLCTFGWSCNIWLLVFANLVGFTYGVHGLHLLLDSFWQHFDGWVTGSVCLAVTAACNLMLYLRYGRPGKQVKC